MSDWADEIVTEIGNQVNSPWTFPKMKLAAALRKAKADGLEEAETLCMAEHHRLAGLAQAAEEEGEELKHRMRYFDSIKAKELATAIRALKEKP